MKKRRLVLEIVELCPASDSIFYIKNIYKNRGLGRLAKGGACTLSWYIQPTSVSPARMLRRSHNKEPTRMPIPQQRLKDLLDATDDYAGALERLFELVHTIARDNPDIQALQQLASLRPTDMLNNSHTLAVLTIERDRWRRTNRVNARRRRRDMARRAAMPYFPPSPHDHAAPPIDEATLDAMRESLMRIDARRAQMPPAPSYAPAPPSGVQRLVSSRDPDVEYILEGDDDPLPGESPF